MITIHWPYTALGWLQFMKGSPARQFYKLWMQRRMSYYPDCRTHIILLHKIESTVTPRESHFPHCALYSNPLRAANQPSMKGPFQQHNISIISKSPPVTGLYKETVLSTWEFWWWIVCMRTVMLITKSLAAFAVCSRNLLVAGKGGERFKMDSFCALLSS